MKSLQPASLLVVLTTAVLLSACGSAESNPTATASAGSSPSLFPTPIETEPTVTTEPVTISTQAPGDGTASGLSPATTPVTTSAAAAEQAPDTSPLASPQPVVTNRPLVAETDSEATDLIVTVGTDRFVATPADTDAARAFADRLPMTLAMHDVNRNEKAFDLPESLPSAPQNPGTVHVGDLMLYGSNTVVIFYESFDTSYNYTRIGSVDDPAGLATALGAGDVSITFS